MCKKIFVVIDMQNDFIDGNLPAEDAKAIVQPLQQKIEDCLKQGYTVVYTMDTHDNDYLMTEEGKNIPIVHCQKGSYGWQLVEGIYKKEQLIFEKAAFVCHELVDFIEKNKFTVVELAGLCTDICIVENALLLQKKLPNISIAVHQNLTAGTTKERHFSTLQHLKEQGIVLL